MYRGKYVLSHNTNDINGYVKSVVKDEILLIVDQTLNFEWYIFNSYYEYCTENVPLTNINSCLTNCLTKQHNEKKNYTKYRNCNMSFICHN